MDDFQEFQMSDSDRKAIDDEVVREMIRKKFLQDRVTQKQYNQLFQDRARDFNRGMFSAHGRK